MQWDQLSRPGDRPVNEDCVGVFEAENSRCFVVADGLGGHGRGDEASRLAVEAFGTVWSGQGPSSPKEGLLEAFCQAQRKLMEEQRRLCCPSQMKTTTAALVVQDDQVVWSHIGDSRVYGFSRGKVRMRTLDHSVPELLVRSGEIREKDIRFHPDRNRLLRVLGVPEAESRFELAAAHPLSRFDAFLLCSDGFWELITEKEMGALLRRASSPHAWLSQMAEKVEEHGKGHDMDNYSAVAIIL